MKRFMNKKVATIGLAAGLALGAAGAAFAYYVSTRLRYRTGVHGQQLQRDRGPGLDRLQRSERWCADEPEAGRHGNGGVRYHEPWW